MTTTTEHKEENQTVKNSAEQIYGSFNNNKKWQWERQRGGELLERGREGELEGEPVGDFTEIKIQTTCKISNL